MSKKKEQLGKGLRALLTKIDSDDTPIEQKKKAIVKLSSSINEIKISHIEPNPFQPRTEFKEEELMELVQSIKTHGLIQPITVRKLSESSYQLISGERRWRASKLAGIKKIPAYIRTADDQGMLELALVENIQRSELNPLEISISYQRLIDECDLKQEDLAKRVGKNRSTVSNYIRLLKLPIDIQTGLKTRMISMGHARALLSVDNPIIQSTLFQKAINSGLSVRALENEIRNLNSASKSKSNSRTLVDPEVRKIKDRLSHHLGCKVAIIRNNKGSGKIVLHFGSDDQFNDVIDIIEE